MAMWRSFIVVFALVLIFVAGLFMVLAPEKIDSTIKKFYRFLHILPKDKALKPLSPIGKNISRGLGLVYLLISIIVLGNCRFEFGKISNGKPKIWVQEGVAAKEGADRLQKMVTDVVQPSMKRGKYLGLVVGVIDNKEKNITGFGQIKLDSDQTPTGETLFEIGSITKVFTGILLSELIEQKRFSIDTTLASALDLKSNDLDSQKGKINFRQLITHTSGLAKMPQAWFNPKNLFTSVTAGNDYKNYSKELILGALSKKSLRAVPGEKFTYSNFGFGLVGLLMGKAEGMNYHKMIEAGIAKPLGLKDTGVELDDNQSSRMASGNRIYLQLGGFRFAQLAERWDMPDGIVAAGGLRSTANDMMVFLEANMGRIQNQIIPAIMDSHKILYENKKTRIGMGWFRLNLPESDKTIIWHNGMSGGFSSFIGFTEDKRFGVIILNNSAKKVGWLGIKILDNLVKQG